MPAVLTQKTRPSVFNPNTKNLITLSVRLRKSGKIINYLFPLNPATLSINQASRVSATFTYGAKVFQNLGAGLKTLSMEGNTGYRIDKDKYGLKNNASSLISRAIEVPTAPIPQSAAPLPHDGKIHWLDLYSLIQLIKGENIYLRTNESIEEKFSIGNIDEIANVQVAIPDQGIVYDVILQNDSFFRNREQPHLYKYKLDFIIIQESLGPERVSPKTDADYQNVSALTASIARQSKLLISIKQSFMALPGIQIISNAYDSAVKYINQSVSFGNEFINAANSSLNDLRRLERMTNALNGVTKSLSNVRGFINQFQTFTTDLKTAFYEPYIAIKNISTQMDLLQKSMKGEQESLSFNVSMTQLASVSAPVTIAANKATVAQFQKDIRQLNSIAFPFPIDRVEEVVENNVAKINIFFKTQPSSLGITAVKVYVSSDFGNENDLVESFSDTNIVLSTSYSQTGYLYNFIIEYNYSTFESIVQPRYKSLKRIMIQNGDTMESIVKRYAPNEANASRSYISEIAYLNNIEYPYVVTIDNPNYEAYFGSYGYKIFSTNDEFMQYIYNINIAEFPGNELHLYESSIVDTTDFLLQQPEVVNQIKTASHFFVLLFKDTYSNRCYALFGIKDPFSGFLAAPLAPTSELSCGLFDADSYVICALEKGRSYDIDNNTIFEILSPYTINMDLIEFYGQKSLADLLLADPTIDIFDKDVQIINEIYIENIGTFTDGYYPYTAYDHQAEDQQLEYARFNDQKTFLAGDEENKNYVILTNFTATGSTTISAYSITAFSKYRILSNGQEILLPSLENTFLPFTEAFVREDTYKVDLDSRFQYLDDIHISILPRPDLGEGQGILDFKLIDGLNNVRQAIKNRLECPQGGLILHQDYGLPVLLGKKNTLENLILLRYHLFSQLKSDSRVRSVDDIQLNSVADSVNAEASVTLVNNDDVLIKTTI